MRGAPVVRCVLIRTGAFSLAASSLLALLPLLARPHGASGYGLLLGFFGLGALGGAAVLPRVRSRFRWTDGGIRHRGVCSHDLCRRTGAEFWLLSLVLFLSGTAWIGILACLNVAAQTMSLVSAGAGLVGLPAGLAGWHGDRQRTLGWVADPGRSPDLA